MSAPQPNPPHTPPRRPADGRGPLTVLFLVLLPLVAIVGLVWCLLTIMGSAICAPGQCDTALMNTGLAIGGFGPWIVLAAALVCTIVPALARRTSFWAPLIGLVLSIVLVVVGVAMIDAQIPNQ